MIGKMVKTVAGAGGIHAMCCDFLQLLRFCDFAIGSVAHTSVSHIDVARVADAIMRATATEHDYIAIRPLQCYLRPSDPCNIRVTDPIAKSQRSQKLQESCTASHGFPPLRQLF